ncbi:MAG TPA: RNA-binding domain-containing protein [Verrucomicrobiae bacterium]|nr:RNA-binding domain-containing protein [Verrucomicrobiae bacterium]
MDEVTVHIEAEINPTEGEDKVKTAVTNVLGNASITIKPSGKADTLMAEAKGPDSLFKLRTILRTDRIRDAARKALFHGTRGNTISFFLNKQVAFAGHVSFSEETAESPLGAIRVTIETDNPQQLIAWLAEKTS